MMKESHEQQNSYTDINWDTLNHMHLMYPNRYHVTTTLMSLFKWVLNLAILANSIKFANNSTHKSKFERKLRILHTVVFPMAYVVIESTVYNAFLLLIS